MHKHRYRYRMGTIMARQYASRSLQCGAHELPRKISAPLVIKMLVMCAEEKGTEWRTLIGPRLAGARGPPALVPPLSRKKNLNKRFDTNFQTQLHFAACNPLPRTFAHLPGARNCNYG